MGQDKNARKIAPAKVARVKAAKQGQKSTAKGPDTPAVEIPPVRMPERSEEVSGDEDKEGLSPISASTDHPQK